MNIRNNTLSSSNVTFSDNILEDFIKIPEFKNGNIKKLINLLLMLKLKIMIFF